VLHPSVPAGSLKEFIALAKQKPGGFNYSSGGVGTPLHLSAELFQKRAGVKMVHLPYKGGGPAAAAVLSGEAQVLFGSVASSMPHVRSGRLKAIATTGIKRSKVVPELPTMDESGFPGFEVTSWYALLVPAKTPAAVVNRIRDVAVKAVGLPDVQQAMSRQGLEVETSTPQQWAAPCSDGEWTQGFAAFHAASNIGLIPETVKSVAEGDPFPKITMQEIDAGNAEQAKEHADCTQAETIDLIKNAAPTAASTVRSLSDAQLDRKVKLMESMPEVTVEMFAQMGLVGHAAQHLATITAAR
jgi:hypothetical protein